MSTECLFSRILMIPVDGLCFVLFVVHVFPAWTTIPVGSLKRDTGFICIFLQYSREIVKICADEKLETSLT